MKRLLLGLLTFFWSLTAQAILPGDYSKPEGQWMGQAEYQAIEGPVLAPQGNGLARLSLSVEPGGRLSGASGSNGCQWSGLVSIFPGPPNWNLDVTLSGCATSSLNRRYTGILYLDRTNRVGRVTLQAYQMAKDGSGRLLGLQWRIKATLSH